MSDESSTKIPEVPAWLAIALGEIGTLEKPGNADNPRVVEYHSATAAGSAPDAVAWCSSFANWCVMQAGITGTRSKAARSWNAWGKELDRPRVGCVCVLWRGSRNAATGHVGFWLGEDRNGVLLLGGNQHNSVNVTRYAKARVLSYRWPDE